jgi:hypothetical protein
VVVDDAELSCDGVVGKPADGTELCLSEPFVSDGPILGRPAVAGALVDGAGLAGRVEGVEDGTELGCDEGIVDGEELVDGDVLGCADGCFDGALVDGVALGSNDGALDGALVEGVGLG